MKRKLIGAGAGLLVLLGLSLFLLWGFRNPVINSMAERKILAMKERYGLDIHYDYLEFTKTGRILFGGLSVVPEQRDTLLTIHSAEIPPGLWQLLRGNLEIRRISMEQPELRFVKKGTQANYDFMFLGDRTSRPGTSRPDKSSAEYYRLAGLLLKTIFRLLPSEGKLTRLRISEKKDNNSVSLYIPEFRIKDRHFQSHIQFVEDGKEQHWQTSGEIDPSEHLLSLHIQAPDVAVPYLKRRLGAEIHFDELMLSFIQKDGSPMQLQGKAEVRGLSLFHHRLSPEVINLNHGEVDFHLNIGSQSIELDSCSTVRFNQLQLNPYLKLESPGHLTAKLHKSWFPASELFSSLPQGLFEHLEGIRVDGQLAYDFLLDADLALPDSLKFHSDLLARDFRIIQYGNTNLSKMSSEFEYTAYEDGIPVRTFPVGPSWEHFLPLDSIPLVMQTAVLQSEDGGFFYHQGFLPDAIQEAMAYDLKKRRFARGGSTISMQLVKNVFLNRNKNIARKLEEALIVWLIETNRLTSKARMFEVYLNIAEWGPMVYGIREAADFYFSKRPSQLTLEECIYLASIIPKPKHFMTSFTNSGQLRESQENHFRIVAGRIAAKGVISEEAAKNVDISRVQLKGKAAGYFTDSLSVPRENPLTPQ